MHQQIKRIHRYIQANMALLEGLSAVVGLNFPDLPAELKVDMMKAMTTTRYKKASETGERTGGRKQTKKKCGATLM